MNLQELFAFVVGGVMIAGLGSYLPGIWRHTSRRLDWQPDLWPYGELGWRAFARCILPIYAVFVLGYGVAAFFVLTGRAPLPNWLAQSTAVCAVAILLITGSVFLFNWPKVVVPPSMRSGPGLLAGLFARRRSAR